MHQAGAEDKGTFADLLRPGIRTALLIAAALVLFNK